MFQRDKLEDKIASQILLDSVDHKLVLAKHYLEKMHTEVSLNYNWKHFVLEANTETFLFYVNLAIENLAYKINLKYELIPEEKFITKRIIKDNKTDLWRINDVTQGGKFFSNFDIYSIKNVLNESIKDQNEIKTLIDNNFSYPRKVGLEWDLSRSYLWMLREMRNHITHSPIINRALIAGADTSSYLFRFTVERYKPTKNGNDEKLGTKLSITIDNPYQFFSLLFTKLTEFVEEIRKIISYEHRSDQYKNHLKFEL